ncbi:hypothetical protein VTN00DRAFT_56 [Thermoascus crustaceus]|uniref:uncharacterized protein n=1 Tax=Thermoascus crustaceus TaxID=5088 RepID=UPI0037427E1E
MWADLYITQVIRSIINSYIQSTCRARSGPSAWHGRDGTQIKHACGPRSSPRVRRRACPAGKWQEVRSEQALSLHCF